MWNKRGASLRPVRFGDLPTVSPAHALICNSPKLRAVHGTSGNAAGRVNSRSRPHGDRTTPAAMHAFCPHHTTARLARPRRLLCCCTALNRCACSRMFLSRPTGASRSTDSPRHKVVVLLDEDDAAAPRVRCLVRRRERASSSGRAHLRVDTDPLACGRWACLVDRRGRGRRHGHRRPLVVVEGWCDGRRRGR